MLRLLGSRALISVGGAALAVVLVAVGYLLYTGPAERHRTYCALMPDAIGLYRDSDVTVRGIAVGTVRDIRDDGAVVRVEFTVADRYALTGEVSATTVADSIVADRDLALLSDGAQPGWDPTVCITRTLTPKSLSAALETLTRFADELRGANAGETGLGAALRVLDQASAGTGGQVNALTRELGSALKAPDVGMARLGRIIDALAELAAAANRGWSDIEAMFTRFSPTFQILDNQLFPMVIELGDALRTVLPMLNDLSMAGGGHLVGGLEATVPLVRWIAANIGGLQEVLTMVPALAAGFTRVTDPQTGAVAVTYAPPRVSLPPAQAAQVCGALDLLGPGLCEGARVDLARLVLGAAVTR
ncbi:MlaD family protein [Nocardia farcinica]|uniref:MlaD family protein n=1 Tax=Nocardia farcinica TaxID=37329 RepID=UPI001894A616|nr:MlaD family protein [Nocardia farcinica]MBF6183639.1 MCE family protein [Nocardia farcinica]MBF6309482.1 MCE family protein [Nocardia farcinica]MBF6406696.1 MCE family protein [Nocardia farcinica]UEX20549.1 MlaD family protein [Nocardia farcinica]